ARLSRRSLTHWSLSWNHANVRFDHKINPQRPATRPYQSSSDFRAVTRSQPKRTWILSLDALFYLADRQCARPRLSGPRRFLNRPLDRNQAMDKPSTAQDNASRNQFYILAISAVAALGGFLFGFDSGVINGTVDALNRAFHSSNLGSGFTVASILLGCAVGAVIAGTLADKFGRRSVLIVTSVLFVLGSWGSGVAHGSLEFILYRVMG